MREDQNPSGSFKDRLIAYLWPQLQALKQPEIVVSSSGNLAISLLYFQKHAEPKLKQRLSIFIKDNLPTSKLARLLTLVEETGAQLVQSPKPKSDCFKYAKTNNAFWLRNSAGPDYPKAYHSMAAEIISYEEQSNLQFSALIIAASSGTAALGLLEGLITSGRKLPVYLVQTSHINAIAKEFDQDFAYEEQTLANAISDRVASRKPQLLKLTKELTGGGIIVNNSQISEANVLLNKLLTGQYTGNAALGLAGFLKLSKKGYNLVRPLIIISGN